MTRSCFAIALLFSLLGIHRASADGTCPSVVDGSCVDGVCTPYDPPVCPLADNHCNDYQYGVADDWQYEEVSEALTADQASTEADITKLRSGYDEVYDAEVYGIEATPVAEEEATPVAEDERRVEPLNETPAIGEEQPSIEEYDYDYYYEYYDEAYYENYAPESATVEPEGTGEEASDRADEMDADETVEDGSDAQYDDDYWYHEYEEFGYEGDYEEFGYEGDAASDTDSSDTETESVIDGAAAKENEVDDYEDDYEDGYEYGYEYDYYGDDSSSDLSDDRSPGTESAGDAEGDGSHDEDSPEVEGNAAAAQTSESRDNSTDEEEAVKGEPAEQDYDNYYEEFYYDEDYDDFWYEEGPQQQTPLVEDSNEVVHVKPPAANVEAAFPLTHAIMECIRQSSLVPIVPDWTGQAATEQCDMPLAPAAPTNLEAAGSDDSAAEDTGDAVTRGALDEEYNSWDGWDCWEDDCYPSETNEVGNSDSSVASETLGDRKRQAILMMAKLLDGAGEALQSASLSLTRMAGEEVGERPQACAEQQR